MKKETREKIYKKKKKNNAKKKGFSSIEEDPKSTYLYRSPCNFKYTAASNTLRDAGKIKTDKEWKRIVITAKRMGDREEGSSVGRLRDRGRVAKYGNLAGNEIY